MMQLLDNIVWHALTGPHAQFSAGGDQARRYARGFSPIIGFADQARPNFAALVPLCESGEHFYTDGWSGIAPDGWRIELEATMFKMIWEAAIPEDNAAPDAVGFDNLVIRPQPVGDLKWVKASYRSVRGRVASEWEKREREFELRVSIPVGASATVFVPARDKSSLKEGGRAVSAATGVRLIRMEKGSAVLAVESGTYRFLSKFE